MKHYANKIHGAHMAEGLKHAKSEVSFEHPAKGENHCGDCVHYRGGVAQKCSIVAGRIEPGDWCKLFERKEK